MTTLTVRDIVDSWLETDDINLVSTSSEAYANNPVSLNSNQNNSDQPDVGVATALYLGEHKYDPNAQGIAIYQENKNLPTAVATILNHVQNKAEFHPASIDASEMPKAFKSYINEIDRTPFLHIVEKNSDEQKFYTKKYEDLIDRIVSLYDGISTQDKTKIKESISAMGKSVFEQKKSEVWKNLFSQATIDFTDYAHPRLIIFYTSLHMKHDDEKWAEVKEQNFTLSRAVYQILPEMIKTFASNLANLNKQSVVDWLSDNTSPKDENVKLCFQKN